MNSTFQPRRSALFPNASSRSGPDKNIADTKTRHETALKSGIQIYPTPVAAFRATPMTQTLSGIDEYTVFDTKNKKRLRKALNYCPTGFVDTPHTGWVHPRIVSVRRTIAALLTHCSGAKARLRTNRFQKRINRSSTSDDPTFSCLQPDERNIATRSPVSDGPERRGKLQNLPAERTDSPGCCQ